MTILELFLNCNKINVICAYEKLFPYEQYDWLNSRNFPNIFKRNKYLCFVIDDIKEKFSLLKGNTSKNIVYVIENQSTNIENKTTDFYVLHMEKPTQKFNISNISNMCLTLTDDEEKNKILYNTEISKTSIEKYGIDICTTIILHELIMFGYKKEVITKVQEHLFEQLQESEKDIKEGNYITMEEMEEHLNSWRDELYESANKYEKALLEANKLKDNYLKKIEKEYRDEKLKENIRYIEDFVNETINEKKDDIDEKLEQLASMLNGRQYLKETTKEIINFAIENNMMICLGASDDLLELLGAIDDEYGACDGVTVYINTQTKDVSLEKFDSYPYYVEAKWCETQDCSWTFKTNLRHKTFNIMEDDELYCVGIVCYLG